MSNSSIKQVISLLSSSSSDSELIPRTGKRRFVFGESSSSGGTTRQESKLSRTSVTAKETSWQPFHLSSVSALGCSPSNVSSLSFADLLHSEDDNPLREVVLMNYMMDLQWIVEQAPQLLSCQSVLCLHGSSVDASIKFDSLVTSKVDLGPERFGTHHSKIALLRYESGLRVVITTANFIPEDFQFRTQAMYVQDFPLKKTLERIANSFEEDLLSYLQKLHISRRAELILHTFIDNLSLYDFESAEVVLIPSVPGRHCGEQRYRWGIGKLTKVLQQENLLLKTLTGNSSRLCMQFSSIGSMGKDAKLVAEYAKRMLLENVSLNEPLLLQQVDVVWPTLNCVKNSLQGYDSGGSLPCSVKNMYDMKLVTDSQNLSLQNVQSTFRHTLRTWDGSPFGRGRATPHMKCYFKYNVTSADVCIDWFLLTSSNLSQAAWGIFQANDSQLYIKSFEMGVLFLPSKLKTPRRLFSCTPKHSKLGVDLSTSQCDTNTTQFQFVAGRTEECNGKIVFPVPFVIPPSSYQSPADQPWVWDIPFQQPDYFGRVRSGTG